MSSTEIKPLASPNSAGRSELKLFAIKTCIVAGAISLSAIFVIEWTISSVKEFTDHTVENVRAALQSNGPIGGRKFWTGVERELDRAAAPGSDLPAAQKQKLVDDVRIIVARWRPLIDAVYDGMQHPNAKQ